MRFSVGIDGVDSVVQKLDARELSGAAAVSWLKKTVRLVATTARAEAPNDQGRLRGGISEDVDSTWPPRGGVRGRARHTKFVHGGMTGSERGLRTRPHWPPWGEGSSLAMWAWRHGIPPFLVARAISLRGTPIVKFIAIALRRQESRIKRHTDDAVRDVEHRWSRS